MKYTRILAALLGVVTLLTTSCGVGDKIGSVSMTVVGATGAGVIDLKGIGGTLQLKVTANYTSGKSIDETNFVTYTVTPERTDDNLIPLQSPPNTVTIDKTVMVTAVEPAVCNWEKIGTLKSPI